MKGRDYFLSSVYESTQLKDIKHVRIEFVMHLLSLRHVSV